MSNAQYTRRIHLGPVIMIIGLTACWITQPVKAHRIGDPSHDNRLVQYAANVIPPTNVIVLRGRPGGTGSTNRATQIAEAFQFFSPRVKTRADDRFFFVESDGIPAHSMMTGITAWQQQVPLPHAYFGENAWRFPLVPVPAARPQTIRNHFLRGAIAIAANGIPIFNPQNNRGEISAEIGELDQWGGHCGRADDYHYHAAPLHLQAVIGKSLPIAYALDGYPLYGLTEPDGALPTGLDPFNGHSTAELGYHYHASTKYPYVNGGFHGEVVEAGQQVDPQPRARPVRPDQPPLRGARVTGFTNSADLRTFALRYSVNGKPASVSYSATGLGEWKFRFVNADGTTREETFGPRNQPVRSRPDGKRAGQRPQSDDKGGAGERRKPPPSE